MNGALAFEPTGGYVVVVLSNLDPPAAQRVATFILDRLPTPAPGGTRVGVARRRPSGAAKPQG
jgi:hypothetical protein